MLNNMLLLDAHAANRVRRRSFSTAPLWLIFSQKLKCDGRPSQVAGWMGLKGQKRSVVPDLELDTFIDSFLNWWQLLQPAWRTFGVESSDPLQFSRGVPFGKKWGQLCKAGS